MSKSATTHRWFSGWRAVKRPQASDPADMGTAFGLELSLMEQPAEAEAAELPRARTVGWVSWIAMRHKAAA